MVNIDLKKNLLFSFHVPKRRNLDSDIGFSKLDL